MDFAKLERMWEQYFKKNDCSLKYNDDFCSWRVKMETRMTLAEIIEKWLLENKYDGLFNAEDECACEIGDLMPCIGPQIDCEPGYKGPCDCKDNHDWHMGFEKYNG